MPTPIFICGAECGIAVPGTASGGVEHWSATAGTAPTISTTTVRPGGAGSRSFRFNPSAAVSNLTHTFAVAVAAPSTVVYRHYVYFATLPSANTRISGVNGPFGVVFNSSDNTLRAGTSGATVASGGATVTTGKWYRIDCKIVKNTTTTVDLTVDGVAQTQYSVAGASATTTNFSIGFLNDTATADMFIDDVIVSGTSGDFPIGVGGVVGLYPNGDGTHVASASTDFGKGSGGGTNVASSDTDTWQSLADPLSDSVATNFLANKTGATDLSEYLTHTYDDLPAAVGAIDGAMFVAATHSATATSNNFTLRLGTTTIMSFDASETSITIPCVIRNTDSAGAAWDTTSMNAVTTRFASSDVTPDVYLDGVCIEVAWPGEILTATGPTVTVTAGTPSLALTVSPTGPTVTITAGTPTVEQVQSIDLTGPTVTVTAGTPALDLAVTPSAPTVSITAGTAELALSVTPTAPTVSITAGTPELALAVAATGPTVTITAGTPALDLAFVLTGPTVSITAGTPALALAFVADGPTVTITAGTATVDGAAGGQSVTATGPTVTVTAGTPELALAVAPTGPTVTITAGTPALALAVTPTGPTVSVTAGTATVAPGAVTIDLTGPTVTVTAGTPELAVSIAPTAPTVTVTAGTPELAVTMTLTGPTVTITAGDPTVAIGTTTITLTGPTVTVTAGTVLVEHRASPITLTVRARGHTATLTDTGHTGTFRSRGHTGTVADEGHTGSPHSRGHTATITENR